MLRFVLISLLSLWSGLVYADPESDAEFYLTHFIGQKNWDVASRVSQQRQARLHREALLRRNVVILDEERFSQMIPDRAAEELVDILRQRVGIRVIEHYGADHLSEIVSFFRTPTGQKMLNNAAKTGLFDRLHYQSQSDGLVGKLTLGLSLLDHNRYRAFTATPAGKAFVETTWVLRRSLASEIHQVRRWPEPPLHRPYMKRIIEADGILKFSNPVARETMRAAAIATKADR